MLYILIENEKLKYEIGELVRLFEDEFEFSDSKGHARFIRLKLNEKPGQIDCTAAYYVGGVLEREKTESLKVFPKDLKDAGKEAKNLMKKAVYVLLSEIHGRIMPWGILTGIRPTKIVHELMDEDVCEQEIRKTLTRKYMLHPDKASLALEIASRERKYMRPRDNSLVSLYVSIPFCPTRCVYCSFPSNTLKQWGHLKAAYVECLIREIAHIARITDRLGKKLQTVYIGGGTPTTLEPDEMKRLIQAIQGSFDFGHVREFTVEAGRVDTIDEKKLAVLREMEIDRISINPQTMNDETLKLVSRAHTSNDVENVFKMAKGMGFKNINMDIIMGLPGEDVEMARHTLERISQLSPESLTVHTMAIKRASKLREQSVGSDMLGHESIDSMVELAMEYARGMGLNPYYMYRQKHILGNLENIGYSREGLECIYNINMMEETQTIFAAGAGGISKIVYPEENRIERVPNVKNIEHYVGRIDEMITRKEREVLGNGYKG